ncbi:hypothetical protein FS837_012725 [Tulasnella sp. UAMH 9824]|nr:hypothetical protein FS837_012725 [Tulasnella sp. UAMH 9824]
MRAGSNPSAGELNGLFKEREPILQENGTIRQDQEKKPQAGAETTKFSNEAAGAPGKNADKDAAASPRTSGPFNSLAQETSEDPQPFIYQYLASTFKKILCIRRVSKGSSKAPFPSLPSTQHRRSSVFETTEDDGPTEPKPPTNAASPETNISTAKSDDSIRMVFAGPDMSVFGSDVQVSLPTGPDARLFESSGQAIGWAETMPIRPPPAEEYPKLGVQKAIDIARLGPRPCLAGSSASPRQPPETPGQAPFPPAPSAEHRRRSISAVSDEALESKRHSWAKQSAPGGSLPVSTDPDIKFPHPSDDSTLQIRPRLEIDELWDDLSSPTRESLKRLDVLDRSGQLTERTETKFTGGFSDVSQAKLGGRVVAVKALRVKNIGGAESQRWERRLARELYVWATLDHPNVLELLGFAFEDGGPCLISPWCDNGTLQEYLQKFPEANRRRLVGEIAEGLRYLHLQTPPIVHGDLKTANVFVTSYDVAKISGLGTSRRVEEPRALSNTDDDLSLATIRYTAPEILRDGQDFTLLSDVFSFACVVLETMTDKFPFWKIANDVQVLTEVVFKKQTPSLEDHPGMEEAIWELLRRCWNYEPSDRPTMIEVCRAVHFPSATDLNYLF